MSPERRVILYHRTSADNADAILTHGFKDSAGYFLDTRIWTGVWFSSIPPGSESTIKDDAVLTVKVEMCDHELARWEWTGEGRNYREWLIPASIVNSRATVELAEKPSYSTVSAEVGVDGDLCTSR